MIRLIDIRLNAAHPELKLPEAVTYTGAPSTALIRGVPPNYGRWAITAVYIVVTFPDGSTTTRTAVQSANGVWVATLPATATSGRTREGFRVVADGIDENGEAATGYILAVADFAVASLAVTPEPEPGGIAYALRYFDTLPDPARKGDVTKIDGDLKFYNGTAWTPFTDLSNYYTAAQTDEAIDKLAAYYITADAQGNPFATHAALVNAQTYYSGGAVRIPTRNDYAIVLADETHGGAEWRYIYAVDAQGVGQWEPQYAVEGVIAYDNTVTRTSANGVKSSGIWAAIWGALTALPTGFSSLYDWCVDQLAGKQSKVTASGILKGDGAGGVSAATAGTDFQAPLSQTQLDNIAAVPNKANDADVVHTTGDETVGGSKVFTGAVNFYDLTISHPQGQCYIRIYALANENRVRIYFSDAVSGSQGGLFLPVLGDYSAVTLAAVENIAPDAFAMLYDGATVDLNTLYCYQGRLYRCKLGYTFQSGDSYPSDDTTHWTPATVEDVLAALRTALAGKANTSDLLTKLNSTSAAPAFSSDSSVSYPVGSHVTYNGKLYKCTTATTGGTWVAASWAEDTMTDADAVLDITSQNQLRVVAKDGTLLWAQGYDLASTSSATLACDAVNNFTFADGATTQAFALPTAPTGKVGDFGLDIDNSANTGAATLTLTGLDSTFSVVVPEGESLNDMLAIAAGELARFYITLSTFRVNNLPTWHIVKQVVENGGATA